MDNAPEKKSADAESNESKITNNQQLYQRLNELLSQKIREIEASESTPEQKEQARTDIAAQALQELKDTVQSQKNLQEAQKRGEDVSQEQQKEAAKKAREAFVNVLVHSDKGLEVVKNKQAQAVIQQLAKNISSADQGVEIGERFGQYFTGDKPILLTGKDQEKSAFEKDVELFNSEHPDAARVLASSIVQRAPDFGKKEGDVLERFQDIVGQGNGEQVNQAQYEAMREQTFDRDRQEYYGRFTQEQQEFLHNLYSPTKFKNYVESKINPKKQEQKDAYKRQKDAYKKRIIEVFEQQEKPIPNEAELEQLADSRWRQKISNDIGSELGMVINQLLLRLQQEGPNKSYDELVQEDFMRGIRATENQIKNALTTLHANLAELEKKDPRFDENVRLYKFFDRGHYTDEREKEVGIDPKTGKQIIKNLPYARLYPLLQPKEIGLKDFATQLFVDMGHLLDQRNYLHDARVVFNHPPGEKGFYGGLAGYAEKYKGTDIDEMMLLPDAPYALEAFHLYEKYLEEDFASIDWRHRPTEFQTRLEYINTQLEDEIIEQMKQEYGGEISEERIRAAVNIGTGMARGVFLPEPEKSAYADPVDAEGVGLFASYGTNDAGALNVFNPLHTGLRWQSESLLPLYYFMPYNAKTGGGDRGLWDHKKTFDEAAKYFDSFKKGGGYLKELKGKGERLFIDDLIDISNVGGVAKRRGWRMQYALEGHMKYNPDGSANVLESFKAMDAIGYEAIADFINNNKDRWRDKELNILKAADGTKLGQERYEFFKYIFDRYFSEFEKTDFDSYMKDLYKLGEAKAAKKLKTEGTMPAGSFEAQAQLEASNIFLQRTIAREVMARFPTKFLRIDRNRFREDGVSRWQKIQVEMGMNRDEFDRLMKDMIFTETLFRKDISNVVKDQLAHDPTLDLHKVKNLPSVLNEAAIEKLLSQIKTVDKDGNSVWNSGRIENVKKLYRSMRKNFFENKDFLNKEAWEAIDGYTFTFGLEDTDLSLIAFRGTGPRMIARAIGDTGSIETNVTQGMIDLPKMFSHIATDGKHDFSPLIEYLTKAQATIQRVHADVGAAKFVYKVAAWTIQYFKKDSAAKPFFGLFRIGKKNSMAAESAGRSTAVWEWDSRDIDRFCVALESANLLKKEPYLLHLPSKYEDRYINFFGKPIKFGKKRIETIEWYAGKLRKEFGGTYLDMAADVVNTFLPLIAIFLLWQYIKKAYEEAEGKKK